MITINVMKEVKKKLAWILAYIRLQVQLENLFIEIRFGFELLLKYFIELGNILGIPEMAQIDSQVLLCSQKTEVLEHCVSAFLGKLGKEKSCLLIYHDSSQLQLFSHFGPHQEQLWNLFHILDLKIEELRKWGLDKEDNNVGLFKDVPRLDRLLMAVAVLTNYSNIIGDFPLRSEDD